MSGKQIGDLKLLDEVLCDIKQETGRTWDQIEHHYTSATHAAVSRLREAWRRNEMPMLTLSLATYFDAEPQP